MKRYESYKPSGISWIGEIPSHWEKMRIKHTGIARNGLTYSPFDLCNKEDNGTLVLRSSNIQRGDICLEDCVYVKSTISPDLKVNAGDIIICSRNGSRDLVGKLALIPENLDASFGAFMLIYRRKEKYKSKYFVFMLPIAIQAYKALFTTSTINQLTQSEFANFQIPIPPLEEQKKIVEYLSTKTSLIDALQSAREKEIRLLEELKQAEIANVVTRGLNPDVPMKKAKTLLGEEIPFSWQLIRNRNILREENILVGNRKDLPLLSLTKSGIILRDIESGKGKFPKDFEKYKEVIPGNIVFCLFDIDETPRTVGLSSHRGMITGAYDVFSINNDIIDSRYLYHYFIAVDNIKALRPYYTGLRKVVPMASFLGIQIPMPPLEEQRAIVEFIEQKNKAIDDMIANLRAEIDFLTEYKQRLIADAVTGQIKID